MQWPWPACRSAKGGLYAWSQSTSNSIILERVSCVASTEGLFTCAEPRCYFASPSVFIMMALFLSFGCGRLRTCHCLIWCHFARVLFHEQTICLSSAFTSLLLEAQTLCPSAVSAAGAFDVQVSQLTVLWFVCFFGDDLLLQKQQQKPLTRSLKPALCCSSICFSLAASVRCVVWQCFMCILWRMLPKQDMPDSVDQPSALGDHCFFCFVFSSSSMHLHNSYSKVKKNAVDNLDSTVFLCFYNYKNYSSSVIIFQQILMCFWLIWVILKLFIKLSKTLMLTIKHKTQETPAEQVIHFEAASFSFF